METTKWNQVFTIVLVCLIGLGITYSFSASSILGLDAYGDMNYFLKKMIVNFTLGTIALIVVMKIPYPKIRKMIPIINLGTIILMFLPLFPAFAVSVNGAERWVRIFGLSFQPSELAKVTIIITIAHMIDVRKRLGILNNFTKGLIPIAMYLAIYGVILITVQKHLSATGLVLLVAGTMLIIGGLAKRYYLLGGLTLIGVAVIAVIIEPFRMKRIFGFMDPEKDAMGSGFHVIQSWYALGSGEIFGLGLGMSRQKFTWLPENHTDFIMAIIGEESGFLGVMLIIVLFAMFVFVGLIMATNAHDTFGQLIICGVMFLIFFQASINMMVVSGLFPVTGVPLPLISYGGTSTIILMMAIGLVYNVFNYTENMKKKKDK